MGVNMVPIATPLIWLKCSLSKLRSLFSNINLTLSKTNSLGYLGRKDSVNLSSQYSIASWPYSWGIFEHSLITSIVVKIGSRLFSQEHFARKSRLSLTQLWYGLEMVLIKCQLGYLNDE